MVKPPLFYRIESAISHAEETAMQPGDRQRSRLISDKLVSALLEARTYVEVGRPDAPEVRLALSRAALVAGGLADDDPALAPLFSRMRLLQEDAANAAAARVRGGGPRQR